MQKGVPGGLLTGILFQYPGFLIAALVGAGAANVLKHPAPWLHGLTSGARPARPLLLDARDRSKLGGLAHGVLALLVPASPARRLQAGCTIAVRLLHLRLVFHAGLAAVGVALVASAARGLTGSTCKLRVTMVINAAAAVITFYYPATYMFPICILAGGLVTLYTNRKAVRLSLCI